DRRGPRGAGAYWHLPRADACARQILARSTQPAVHRSAGSAGHGYQEGRAMTARPVPNDTIVIERAFDALPRRGRCGVVGSAALGGHRCDALRRLSSTTAPEVTPIATIAKPR